MQGRGRLAGKLEEVVGHTVVAPVLVELGHHRNVAEEVVRHACLAEELTTLPYPQAVRSVVAPPDRLTRAVVREALAVTPSSAPGFAGKLVVEGRDEGPCGQTDPFAGAVAQLDRSLEALAREAPLTVEHLEKRALVRQGYKAALHWPLAKPALRSEWRAQGWSVGRPSASV